MTPKREFYTTNEIAQILGLSPFTVRRYIQTRKLKAVKLEGSYRVRQSHLDQFIEDRELETVEELAALEPAPTPIEKKPAPRSPERKPQAKIKPRPPTHRKEDK